LANLCLGVKAVQLFYLIFIIQLQVSIIINFMVATTMSLQVVFAGFIEVMVVLLQLTAVTITIMEVLRFNWAIIAEQLALLMHFVIMLAVIKLVFITIIIIKAVVAMLELALEASF
jgi:hypothetical protein